MLQLNKTRGMYYISINIKGYLHKILQLKGIQFSYLNSYLFLLGVAQYRRLRPPAWIAEDVTVTGDSSSGYDINIKLRGCAFNLPLFSALGAQVNTSIIDLYYKL